MSNTLRFHRPDEPGAAPERDPETLERLRQIRLDLATLESPWCFDTVEHQKAYFIFKAFGDTPPLFMSITATREQVEATARLAAHVEWLMQQLGEEVV